MNRPLSTIPLPAAVLSTLREHGFHYYEDVIDKKGLITEAKNILHQWHLDEISCWQNMSTAPTTFTALDVLQKESSCPGIVTWSKALDDALCGGIPLRSITELCGPPGCGKTQICLQLCVDVQIPKSFGGLGGEAVFIDTASGFCPERFKGMAEACSKHCALLNSKIYNIQGHHDSVPSSDKILDGVHFISIQGITQLLAAVKLLPSIVKQYSKVHLIVIDSLAFPFICGSSCSTIDRTGYLYQILNDLQKLAEESNLAVVITNQLTTLVSVISGEKRSEVIPALGETFGHRVNQRLVLGRISQDSFMAVLLKGCGSSKSSSKEVYFRITSEGIRD